MVGDEIFMQHYPDYSDDLATLTLTLKNATKKLTNVKKKKKEELLHFEREKKTADRTFFIKQVLRELEGCVWENLTDPDEIKESISMFDIQLKNFDEICKNLVVCYGDQAQELDFTDENEKLISSIREKIQMGKNRVIALKNRREWFEIEKLQNQVFRDLDGCVWESLTDIDEVKQYISTFEGHLNQCYEICSELEIYGDQVKEFDFTVRNEKLIHFIKDKIQMGKDRVIFLKNEKERLEIERLQKEEIEKNLAESNRIQHEKTLERQKNMELLICAKNLHFEISTRHTIFMSKCSIDLNTLNDFEILDLKKREENLHVELRELIDKVSNFEKFVLPCGDLANDLRIEVSEMRLACSKGIMEYLTNLSKVISDRDISEKKLKNSASLKIELKKFKGYDSDMDVYTFKSEFKKLIEPEVQKALWADYLKKNFLSGPALNLVLKIEEIDDIWKKLLEVYGNTHLMLQNKLRSLDNFRNLDKLKDDEKIANQLAGLLNVMEDLSKLAKKYNLENDLYYGMGMHKILDFMGRYRERNFIKSIALSDISSEEKWLRLVGFLQSELKEREAYVLNDKVRKSASINDDRANKDNKKMDTFMGSTEHKGGENTACFICDKKYDHVLSYDENKKPFVAYIACKVFAGKTCRERDKLLFKKKFCNKCLTPGVKYNADHVCNKNYVCNQTYVKDGKNFKCEKHVLVCGYHCNEKSNADIFETYKKNVLKSDSKFFDFTKKISISCFVDSYLNQSGDPDPASIYAFQTIEVVSGFHLNFFYDNGCGEAIISKEAVDRLMDLGRATLDLPGPLVLNGVNKQESICEYGIYAIKLPLKNGNDAKIRALCLDEITAPFPIYQLGQVENDIRAYVEKTQKGLLNQLPRLPKEVGGKVHVMLGKHYMKYFPREIVRLNTGLTLYDSMFQSHDHSSGICCGPHPEFTKIHQSAHLALDIKHSYYSPDAKLYIDFLSDVKKVPLLGNKESFADPELVKLFPGNSCSREEIMVTNSHLTLSSLRSEGVECLFGDPFAGEKGLTAAKDRNVYMSKRGPRCLKKFEQIERSGTEVSYRCMDCRNCKQCLKGGLIEEISLQEEAEQDLICKNVSVNIEKRCSSTNMPFIADPDTRLVTNDKSARKIFDSQIKGLSKSEKDRNDTIESEKKLQDLGYVDWLENLDINDQDMIMNSPVKYFIPWRVVWSNSVSTPVRTVFDASSKTASGYSLNDILPKGTNNLNNLVEIILRWKIKKFGYHTDVRKMYNSVQMNKDFWRFQLYWWSRKLIQGEEPKIKVIKTAIYGVRPSGNQAGRALRLVVELTVDDFPMAYDIVVHDVYVDDCISGECTEEERERATDQLKRSLEKGGFTLKGFTFSGEDPDDNLSTDGESILVGGVRWFPKEDYLMLNVGKINFSRKIRGRNLEDKNEMPDNLTKRICASVTAKVFDRTGKVTPIIAGIKLDLSHLHKIGLGWDDKIPESLRAVWKRNFEMIEELGTLKYKRVIVPPDAKNLDITTLDFGDASSSLICVAIYARFELKD